MTTPNYDPRTGFIEKPWPPLRNAVLAVLEQSRPHPCWGLLEIDVTETLARITECQSTLRLAVSFHTVVLHALAKAAAANPGILTYRHKRHLVTFNQVDVCTTIDRHIQGVRIPAIYCVRAAHQKSLAEINWELRAAIRQREPIDPAVPIRRRVAAFPTFIRRAFNAIVRRNPHWIRRLYGTIALTSLRTPGLSTPFWGLPPTLCTLTAAVGTIVNRVGLDPAGHPVPRKSLCMSGTADHAVVDGMALARFTADFVRILEGGSSLDDRFLAETRSLAAADPATLGPRPIPH